MATATKRKHQTVDEQITKTKRVKQDVAQPSIRVFAKFSKKIENVNSKTSKASAPADVRAVTPEQTVKSSDRKRKRTAAAQDSEEVQSSKKEDEATASSIAQPSTPKAKRSKNAIPPSPAGTPSSKAASLFSSLQLDPHPRIEFMRGTSKGALFTPPITPESKRRETQTLPEECEDFVDMYSAFLSALVLFYAHHGTSTPAALRDLLPMITNHWKKRAVTLDDVRHMLGISDSTFQIQTNSKTGPALLQRPNEADKQTSSFIDVDRLTKEFDIALRKRYITFQTTTTNPNPTTFLNTLPLAPLLDTTLSTNALFTRGATRLASLKSASATNPSKSAPILTTPTQSTTTAPASRTSALLDRIHARATALSSLPAAPSAATLSRIAAAQRTPDVARVVTLLCASERASFSLGAVVEKVQMSLRTPVGKEEVERAVEVLGELVPGFVRVVRSGGVVGVVVVRGKAVGREELGRRVEEFVEGLRG